MEKSHLKCSCISVILMVSLYYCLVRGALRWGKKIYLVANIDLEDSKSKEMSIGAQNWLQRAQV